MSAIRFCEEHLRYFSSACGDCEAMSHLSALAVAQTRIEELTERAERAENFLEWIEHSLQQQKVDVPDHMKDPQMRVCFVFGTLRQRAESAESRLSALTTENERLKECLQWLVDLQNGCPLPKYEKDWNRTMAEANALLSPSAAKTHDASGGAVWHDIETAPKDGTKILVIKEYFDPYRKLPMSWHDIAYWTTHNSGGWVSATAGTPTHWRPLPPPPADGGVR